MSSSKLRALLVQCLGASSSGREGLATCFLWAAQARGLSARLDALVPCHENFNSISKGCLRASKQTVHSHQWQQQQQQQQQQHQWQQLTVCSRRQSARLLPSSSMWHPASSATATAGCMQQQHLQHAGQQSMLPRMLHMSAAAWKRVSIPDEMEVLLDEDEDIDVYDSESEGEQLDDPEWICDGELATSRHVSSGASSSAYNTDDDDMGEFDVEFDEAWEDEEEVDDLRDVEDSGSASRHR